MRRQRPPVGTSVQPRIEADNMRLLGETNTQELSGHGSDASGLGAALVISAIGAGVIISAIIVLCAGSSATSKPDQTQESESKEASNMNQAPSGPSKQERPREEDPVQFEGTDGVSCNHLVSRRESLQTSPMSCLVFVYFCV